MNDAWHVYILKCGDGSLYTGVAIDLQRRLQQHNGELVGGPRYTRGRRPVELLWSDTEPDRSAAQRREASIKKLSRDEKLRLLQRLSRSRRWLLTAPVLPAPAAVPATGRPALLRESLVRPRVSVGLPGFVCCVSLYRSVSLNRSRNACRAKSISVICASVLFHRFCRGRSFSRCVAACWRFSLREVSTAPASRLSVCL